VSVRGWFSERFEQSRFQQNDNFMWQKSQDVRRLSYIKTGW
jgi:hypothetical protein